jgi:hypothetical protein
MSTKPLSPHELRVWHAFRLMGEDVMARVGRDIADATGLSGAEFGVLSRLAALGKGEMRQQALGQKPLVSPTHTHAGKKTRRAARGR